MIPRVSLIVPTGNRNLLLKHCIAQAMAQTCVDPFEVIVVDGGSSGDRFLRSFEAAHFFRSGDLRFYSVDPKTTVGERRNIAIEHARGELIAHFDDDDFYHPNYLGELLQWWDAQDPLALGGFSQFWHYDFLRKRGWKTNLWDAGHPYGATFLYPKSTWESVGGFPAKQRGEDQDFFQAIERSLGRIAAAPRPDLYIYMRHTHNVTGPIDPVFHADWTKAARTVLGDAVGFYDDLAELVHVPQIATEGPQYHLPQNLRSFRGPGAP